VGYDASRLKFYCKYKALVSSTLTDKGKDAFKIQQIVGVAPDDTEVPEPAALALVGFGVAGYAAARRRKAA